MNDESIKKLLKKHGIIVGSRSIKELIEIIEITCDQKLDRYNRTKNEELQDDIAELQDIVSYLEKNMQRADLLVFLDEEKEEAVRSDVSELKKTVKKPSSTAFVPSSAGNFGNSTQSNSTGQAGGTTQAAPAGGRKHLWFVSVQGDNTIDNLFILAEDALKYGEWDKAERMFASIQNMENNNPGAYFGKVLAKYHKSTATELASDGKIPLDSDFNMSNAYQYGNAKQKKYMDDLMKEWQNAKVYVEALVQVSKGDQYSLRKAAELMESISSYKDASTKAAEYRRQCDDILKAESEKNRIEEAKRYAAELLDKFRKATDKKQRKSLVALMKNLREQTPETKSILTDTIMKNEVENNNSGNLNKKKIRNKKGNNSRTIATSAPKTKKQRKNNPVMIFLLSCVAFIAVSVLLVTMIASGKIKFPDAINTAIVGMGNKASAMFTSEEYYFYHSKNRKDVKENVTIPTGTKRIGIENSETLKTLVIEGNVEVLFLDDCVALESIEIKGNVIGDITIYGCRALKSIGVNGNLIKNLDISDCASLSLLNGKVTDSLELTGTNLTIEKIEALFTDTLTYIEIASDELVNLDVSDAKELRTLTIRSEKLKNVKTAFSGLDKIIFEDVKLSEKISTPSIEWCNSSYAGETQSSSNITGPRIRITASSVLETVENADGTLIIDIRAEKDKKLILPDGIKSAEIGEGIKNVSWGSYNEWNSITELQLPKTLEKFILRRNSSISSIISPEGNLSSIAISNSAITELDVSASNNLSEIFISDCLKLDTLKTSMDVDECSYTVDTYGELYYELLSQGEKKITIASDGDINISSIAVKQGVLKCASAKNPNMYTFPEGIKKVTIKDYIVAKELSFPKGIEVVNISGCHNLSKYNMPDSLKYFYVNGETLVEK